MVYFQLSSFPFSVNSIEIMWNVFEGSFDFRFSIKTFSDVFFPLCLFRYVHENQISGSNCFLFIIKSTIVSNVLFSPLGQSWSRRSRWAMKLNQVKATWILIVWLPNILILSGFHQTLIRLLEHIYWFREHNFRSFVPHSCMYIALMQLCRCYDVVFMFANWFICHFLLNVFLSGNVLPCDTQEGSWVMLWKHRRQSFTNRCFVACKMAPLEFHALQSMHFVNNA